MTASFTARTAVTAAAVAGFAVAGAWSLRLGWADYWLSLIHIFSSVTVRPPKSISTVWCIIFLKPPTSAGMAR